MAQAVSYLTTAIEKFKGADGRAIFNARIPATVGNKPGTSKRFGPGPSNTVPTCVERRDLAYFQGDALISEVS